MCMSSDTPVPEMPKEFPNDESLSISRKYDQSYGDPSAPFLDPGNAKIKTTTYDGAIEMSDTGKPGNPFTINKGQADDLRRAWIASQRSPIMALGFDPRKMTVTDPVEGETGLTAAGFYQPEKDQLWIDRQYRTTFVHESIHRSMEMLRKEGKLPEPPDGVPLKEEYLVRAFMVKHFGDAEKGRGDVGDQQVEMGKYTLDRHAEYLKKIEDAAAQAIAKRKPRGPK